MRKSAVAEESGLENALEGAASVEVAAHANGNAAGGVLRSSVNADDWDLREMAEEEENPAKTAFEKARADEEEAQIEAMTAEEAEETLRQITEFEGRLPITVRRRNALPLDYYVRMPKASEITVAERLFVIAFHKNRKDGIPSLSEFLQELTDGLSEDQRERYDEISKDETLLGYTRSQALIDFFLTETPHVGLVQMTSDVLARREQNAFLVSCCVEEFVEEDGKKKWQPVWKTPSDYAREDSDVSASAYLDMFTTQAKLENARFLPSSSDAASPGSPKS